MKNDLKVLHVIDGFGVGGAETWLLNCVRFLNNSNNNLRLDFLVTSGEQKVYDQEIKGLGSKIHYLKYSLYSGVTFGRKFRKILKENNYDAIHSHLDFVTGWLLFFGMGKLPRVRISHLHNPYNFVNNYRTSIGRSFSYYLGRCLTMVLVSKISGTSNYVMDEYGYHKFPFKIKRIRPLYCGFDTTKFEFSLENRLQTRKTFDCEDSIVVLFVGRIGTRDHNLSKNQKNPLFAYEIAKSLAKDNKYTILFVGQKGSQGQLFENEVAELGLQNSIYFLGERHDVPDLMSVADIMIFPSKWEGLGMVAVEAQASGLSVIISDMVPTEAIVNDNLVTKLSISNGIDEWVNNIKAHELPNSNLRKEANRLVSLSDFSIEKSIDNLYKAYVK